MTTLTKENTAIQKKMLQGIKEVDRLGNNRKRMLLKLYKSSLKEIKSKVASLYEKMQNEPSMAKAQQYKRLQNLEINIQREVNRLTQKVRTEIKKTLQDSIVETFNRSGYAVESTLLAKAGFGTSLDRDAIYKALLNDMPLIKWEESLKANQTVYLRQIKQEISKGLIQGKGYQQIAKAITERANIGVSKVIRIVNTETHRAQSKGTLEAYNRFNGTSDRLGLKASKQWISTLDADTRTSHQELDKQVAKANSDGVEVFKIRGLTAEAPGMFGVAEEDINCRCTTVLEFEGVDESKYRRARENGKSVLVEDMSYKEWAKKRLK